MITYYNNGCYYLLSVSYEDHPYAISPSFLALLVTIVFLLLFLLLELVLLEHLPKFAQFRLIVKGPFGDFL